MEKYINKGFDTLRDLTSFLNEKEIPKNKIIHIGTPALGGGYILIYVE